LVVPLQVKAGKARIFHVAEYQSATRFTIRIFETACTPERDIVEVVVEDPSGSRRQSDSGFLHRSAATEGLV
jgi:hypothetical protein